MHTPETRKSLVAAGGVCVVTLAGLLGIHWPLLNDLESLKFFGNFDAWVYTGSALYFMDHSLHAGEFPLWNPLVFCGQPIAGNPQYLLFYPPNLLRSLLTVTPTPWNTAVGLAVLAFAHGVAAALGGYAFGRFRGLSRAGAAFAGVVFALSSAYLQRFFLHHHMIFVVAWLPWNLLAVDWAGRSESARQAVGRYTVAGVVFAMTILAGSPGLTYFVAIGMVLYWITARIAGSVAQRRIAGSARDLYGAAIAIAAAVALSAALVFPSIEFIRNTQRIEGASEKIELEHSEESASLGEAMFFYPGGETHEGIKGIGAGAAILCVIGLFSPLRREAAVFFIVGGVLLASSRTDSSIMHRMIGPLAPFPISSPGRLTLIAVFPLSMLAGLGLDRLRTPIGSRTIRLLATGATVAMTLLVAETLYSYSLTTPEFMGVPTLRALAFPLMCAAAALGAIWLPLWKWPVAFAAGIALLEPLYWQSAKIRAVSAQRDSFATLSLDAAQREGAMWTGNTRNSRLMPNSALYALEGQINGYDPLQLRGYSELAGPPDVTSFWRGEVEVGRWSDRPYLLMKRAFWLHRQFVSGEIPPRGTKFPVTTTAFVSDPPPLHAIEVNAETLSARAYSDDVERIELLAAPIAFHATGSLDVASVEVSAPPVLPQINTTLHLRVRSTGESILAIQLPDKADVDAAGLVAEIPLAADSEWQELDIPLPDSDLGRIEFSPTMLSNTGTLTIESAELLFDRSDEGSQINVRRRTANSVEVEVRDLPGYRILSYIDFAYPGWHAYVDGDEVPLLTTFSYFKGVEVPPGTHRVRFVYRPATAYAGIAASLGSAGAAGVVIVVALAGGRRRNRGDGPA